MLHGTWESRGRRKSGRKPPFTSSQTSSRRVWLFDEVFRPASLAGCQPEADTRPALGWHRESPPLRTMPWRRSRPSGFPSAPYPRWPIGFNVSERYSLVAGRLQVRPLGGRRSRVASRPHPSGEIFGGHSEGFSVAHIGLLGRIGILQFR